MVVLLEPQREAATTLIVSRPAELRQRGPPSMTAARPNPSGGGLLFRPPPVGTPGFLPKIVDEAPTTTKLMAQVAAAAAASNTTMPARRASRRSHDAADQQEAAAAAMDDGDRGVDEDDLLRITNTEPEARNEADLRQLQRFTSNVKFFKELNDPSLHLELCRNLLTKTVEDGTPVFMQGDEGARFYIIYKGAVKVFVKAKGKDPQLTPKEKKKVVIRKLKEYLLRAGQEVGAIAVRPPTPPGQSKPSLLSILQEAKKSLEDQYGSCVATLEDGASFGELALLGNGLRAASVVPIRDTQFLWVDKGAYDKCIRQAQEEELTRRLAFLRSVFLFSDWKDDDLTRLAKVLTKKRYAKYSMILQEGTMTDCMYFVLSGHCRVLKAVPVQKDLQQKLALSRDGLGIQQLLAEPGGKGGGGGGGGPPSPGPGGGGGSPRAPNSARSMAAASSPRSARQQQQRQTQQQQQHEEGRPQSVSSAAPAPASQQPPSRRRGSVLVSPFLDVSRNKAATGSAAAAPATSTPRRPSLSMRPSREGVPEAETVVLEIGQLGPRFYFGDLALMEAQKAGPAQKAGQHTASIVAADEVCCLLLSKYDFYHFIGGTSRTAKLLKQYAEKYYFTDEAAIRRSIRGGGKWDEYKRRMMKELGSPRQE